MSDILKNIFKRPESDGYATVSRRLTATRVEVTDATGRITPVDHDRNETYSIGTAVVVRSGRIIGRGGPAKTTKVYEV